MSDDRDDEEVADYGDDAMVQVDENDADDRSSYNGSHIDEDSVVGMETTTEAAGTTAADRNGNPTEPPQRSIPPPKPIIVDREKVIVFVECASG
jgi:hypothetical protein